MARRASLPGADELFRSTGDVAAAERGGGAAPGRVAADANPAPVVAPAAASAAPQATRGLDGAARGLRDADASTGRQTHAEPRSGSGPNGRSTGVRKVTRARQAPGAAMLPSGRERHEEKITVYVSPQELLDLERARWVLRAEHGLASDRGRIVREAVAVVLADFEAKGADSILVTRLQES